MAKQINKINDIIAKIGIDINHMNQTPSMLQEDLAQIEFLLKNKTKMPEIDQLFYTSILLPETQFYKQIKPSIQLKIRILKWLALKLGYRI